MTVAREALVSPEARRTLVFLLVAVVVSLATRWVSLAVGLVHIDEAAHLLGSRTVLEGGDLYVDFVDNKPPLLYAYFALAQLLFGRGLFAVHLLTALVVVPLTAFGVSAFFDHDRRGLVAGLAYLLFSAVSWKSKDVLAVNGELLMLAPAVWGCALVRDARRASRPAVQAAAGVLIAVAVLFKQHAACWLAVLPVTAWFSGAPIRRRLAAAAAVLVGFAMPLLATWALFAARGHAAELVYWTVTYNVDYSQNPILASEALVRVARKLVPWVLMTAGLWWGIRPGLAAMDRDRRVIAACMLLLAMPTVFVGWRMYPHYYLPLVVPLSLTAGAWVAPHLMHPITRGGRIAVAYAVLVTVGSVGWGAWQLLLHPDDADERDPAYARVAERLREDPCRREDSTLFVWGVMPTFYYVTGLAPASRFVVPQGTVSGYICGNYAVHRGIVPTAGLVRRDHQRLLLEDLEGRPPTYILDTTGWRPGSFGSFPVDVVPSLRSFIDQGYEPVDQIDGLVLSRRRGCGG